MLHHPNRAMIRIGKYIVVLVLNLLFVNIALSDTLKINSDGVVSGYSLSWAPPIPMLGTFNPAYDAIEFEHSYPRAINIYVAGDVNLRHFPNKVWANVTMGHATSAQNVTANFYGSKFEMGPQNTLTWSYQGHTRTLQMGVLTLNHVDLVTELVTLSFTSANNVINLSSSSMTLKDELFHTDSTAPLTINALSGQNEFVTMSGVIGAQTTHINVNPGSSLKFTLSGERAPTHYSQRLYFRDVVIGLVDNATLEFNSSNVYFNSSQFQFVNNSILKVTGYFESKAQFRNLSIINSQITQVSNSRLQVDHTLTLQGATISMNAGATMDAKNMIVTADSTISGEPYDDANRLFNSDVNVSLLNLRPSVAVTQNGAHVNVHDMWLEADATYSVTNGGRISVHSLTAFSNNVINVSSGSILAIVPSSGIVYGGFAYDRILRDVTFNIDSSSAMFIEPRARLESQDNPSGQAIFNNDGYIRVKGFFGGNGTIYGVGRVGIYPAAVLAPGFVYEKGRIHTMTFENKVQFYRLSVYQVDLALSSGTPINDRIEYIDRNIDIQDIGWIEVNVTGNPGATALDGKSFTVISSRDAASTGTIVRGASDPTILEDATVPALIDFTITDDNTNGHTDVTLNAVKQGASSLLTHPSVTTPNASNTASLLVNAANSGNTTVQAYLNTLQNGQVSSHFNSVHAEPYSSYMTVALEQIDLVRDSVMSHASPEGMFSAGKSHIRKDRQGKKRAWMDVLHVDGDIDGDTHLGGFDYRLSSVTLGQDVLSSDNTTWGGYFSYGDQEMDEHDVVRQTIKGKVYHLGVYSYTSTANKWSVRSVAGYAYGEHESKRRIMMGSHRSNVRATYDSHAVYAGVRCSTPWIDGKNFKLAPEVGAGYSYYRQSAFKESGDPALGLRVDKASAQSITTSVGLNAQGAPLFSTSVRPQAFVRYEHDWYANANDKHTIDAALVSQPTHKRGFVGRNRGEHAGTVGLGVISDLSSALQISGGVVYSITTHGKEVGVGLNLIYKW